MRAGWLVLATALLSHGAAAQLVQPEPSGLQRCVAEIAAKADFSGAIIVSQNGTSVAQLYRGTLAGADSAGIDQTTRFNLGSASKMFTAVAIGQLVEQGKLRLDQPIGEVVLGLTPEAGRVTIGQLLTHTSGLGDFFAPQNLEAMLRARSASDLLPLIAADKPAFTPGSKFQYSNSGFALLGIAIERVSGRTYGEYLRRNIFMPAGMTSSGLDPRPLETLAVGMTYKRTPAAGPGGTDAAPAPGGPRLIGPSALPSEPRALRPAPGAREGYGSPAGGLFSTAEDMIRFATALERGALLSRATVSQLTAPQVEVAPATEGKPARFHGLGFGLADEGGVRWVGHNGGTLGANVEFWFAPKAGWTVEVLSNRDPPVATELMRKVRPLVGGAAPATCG